MRWPAGEGSWGDQAYRGGQLGMTRPAEEGSWGQPGRQGRAVGGGTRSAGEAVGAIRPAGEGS